MLSERFLLVEMDFRLVGIELRPVDGTLFKVIDVEPLDGNRLIVNGIVGMLTPFGSCRNDNPPGERFFCGTDEEGINVTSLDGLRFGIALALDGSVAVVVSILGNDVNAGVCALLATLNRLPPSIFFLTFDLKNIE